MQTTPQPRRAPMPALGRWSAFGASALAGLAAGIRWAPAPGQHSRPRLAARFQDWSRTLAGRWSRWHTWFKARATRRPPPAAGPDLAARPECLLTE